MKCIKCSGTIDAKHGKLCLSCRERVALAAWRVEWRLAKTIQDTIDAIKYRMTS